MRTDETPLMNLPPEALDAYRDGLHVLRAAHIPVLVGGAFALARHAGVVRYTKDFDLFLRPGDIGRALRSLADAGFQTELTFPHWLGKAYRGDHFMDLIFSSGNGLCTVDDDWFAHATPAETLGVPVRMVPPEEMIWSKGFIQERERFDGADIAHLLRTCGRDLDWTRLLRRFGPHWRVLFGHLILFGYAYPGERDAVPAWVLEELAGRLRDETAGRVPDAHVCQGTLLSREQYLPDLQQWGYADARQRPLGPMARQDIAHWTEAIDSK